MKGIVVTANNQAYIKEFDKPLFKTLGEVVGGFIEIVRPKDIYPLVMIVNDEGLIKKLPCNFIGCSLYGTDIHGAPIVGDIVIMCEGFDDETGEPDVVGLNETFAEQMLQTINNNLDTIKEVLRKK